MAKATGTIDFSSAPAQYAKITIDDGQGNGFSQVTFLQSDAQTTGREALSGTSESNNQVNGNASKHLTMYQLAGTNKSFMYISFQHDGQTSADFRDMATGGSTPLIYEFTDADGNVLNVTLVNESSGYTPTVGSGTNNGRKDSAGNYSLNTNLNLSSANIAESLKLILNQAKADGELNISTATRDSTQYLNFKVDANGTENGPLKFRIKRASGSWTTTAKAAAHVQKDDASATGHRIANLFAPDEPVYSVRHAPNTGGTLTAAAYASYFAATINNLPIEITATVSDTEVSLTNDNHGTGGNVTITTSGTTNASISGMSGGAAEGGGPAVAKRLKISARQIAISGSGGLSGSADGKSALMLDLAGLAAASIAQTDVLAFADVGSSNLPKKITFSDFEDAVFANMSGSSTQVGVAAAGAVTLRVGAITGQTEMTGDVADADELMISDGGQLKRVDFSVLRDAVYNDISGDATVADGGALTIGANAVQGSMLNTDVISAQTEMTGDVADADELLISDGGVLKRADFSVVRDAVFNDVSGDATIASGGAVTMASAQTNIGSLLKTDIKIGEDDETKIDFETPDEIHFYAANAEQVYVADGIFGPQTDSDVDLGSTGVRWKDAYLDSVTVTNNVTVGGNTTIEGNLTVQGSTVTLDVANLQVEDTVIGMGISGSTEGSPGDRALVMHITGETNPVMFWDEDENEFAFARITGSASTTTIGLAGGGYADLRVNAIDVEAASTIASLKVEDLTSGRVVLAGTGGEIEDSGNLTFNGSQLTATGHMSASQNIYAALAITASFFSGDGSGLTGVGASVAEASAGGDAGGNLLQLTFVSGAASAASFFMQSGSLSWRPSTDTLETVNISGSGNLDIGGTLDS